MKETFKPKEKYAKSTGNNMRISTKSAVLICKTIRNKPLRRATRLLEDLYGKRRTLGGKYYSRTVFEILVLLKSCQKNAEFKNLDIDRLFVHASAHKGQNLRRRRRKGSYGSKLKNTNMEIMLIERGKAVTKHVPRKKIKEQMNMKTDTEKEIAKEEKKVKSDIKTLEKEQKKLEENVEKAKQVKK